MLASPFEVSQCGKVTMGSYNETDEPPMSGGDLLGSRTPLGGSSGSLGGSSENGSGSVARSGLRTERIGQPVDGVISWCSAIPSRSSANLERTALA